MGSDPWAWDDHETGRTRIHDTISVIFKNHYRRVTIGIVAT